MLGGTAWRFGLPIRITNITEEPITLTRYRLLYRPDRAPWSPFVPDVQAAVDASVAALSAEHSSELFIDEIVVPPGESITRWFIGSTYALPPEGGRPALTLQFEDVSGDTYNVNILAQSAVHSDPRRDYSQAQADVLPPHASPRVASRIMRQGSPGSGGEHGFLVGDS